ncbi:MAG: hypothetical protein ACOVLK_09750 [Terrimicrobiaceae bacterium]
MGWRKNARALGLDCAGTDANRLNFIQRLGDQTEMKTGGAESLDGTLRAHNDAGVFHRVVEVVFSDHG